MLAACIESVLKYLYERGHGATWPVTAMMPLKTGAALVFLGGNLQSYGDLLPVLGTKLGEFGIRVCLHQIGFASAIGQQALPAWAWRPFHFTRRARTSLVKMPQGGAPGSHCCTARQAMLIGRPKTHVSVSRPGQKGINRKFRYVVILPMH
jgi:hypothetical protein